MLYYFHMDKIVIQQLYTQNDHHDSNNSYYLSPYLVITILLNVFPML